MMVDPAVGILEIEEILNAVSMDSAATTKIVFEKTSSCITRIIYKVTLY